MWWRRSVAVVAPTVLFAVALTGCGSNGAATDARVDGKPDATTDGAAGTGGAGTGAAGTGGAGTGAAGTGAAGTGAAGTGGAGTGAAGTGAAGTGAAGTGAAGTGAAGTGAAGTGAAGTGGDAAAGTTGQGGKDGGIPDGGVDVSVDVSNDGPPPAAPTALNAVVLDRRNTSFQLSWVAPGTSAGAPVSGYQIRYANQAITAQNFDDSTVTSAFTYAGTPANVGQPDGIAVQKLYIENDYYFAVAAVDAAGNRSAPVATSAAVKAHFNVQPLTGTGATNEEFGFGIESSGDVNGDGAFDLAVSTFNGQQAYLYLANKNGTVPAAPSVTFSSAGATAFGRGAIAMVGDVDKDGLDDLAITDRAAPRVLIYKGRATWPATLTDANASYVITPDASYTSGVLFGNSLARLGDFNGDGADDFAIGVPQYATSTGRVVIVLGKTGFGNVTLPDTTNTILIDGDANIGNALFGFRVIGLGHYYAATTGTTLVVGSPGSATGASGSEGHLYAFHGQGGTAGAIAIGSADHSVVGNALRTRLGTVLSNLGPIFSTLPSVGSGNPNDRSLPSGSAWVFNGSATVGPFNSNIVVQQAASPTQATNNGMALVGGGVSGLDRSFSLIGDAKPDVIQVPQSATTFFIIDGRKLVGPPTPTSPSDSGTLGVVPVAFPASWGLTQQDAARILPDINGDTYPDIAVSNASGVVAGSVVIYW